MADFMHLLESYDVRDQLDDIASADPPAYLRRCFAEGSSAPRLSRQRIQQLAVCAMVLDAIVNDRDHEFFERELMADWRTLYIHGLLEAAGHRPAGVAPRAGAGSAEGCGGRR